jgi:hypothetical protein
MSIQFFNIVDDIDFPYPDQKLKIGVKMSGGLDSASMLYVLCDLKSRGLLHAESELIPITGINWPRPYQAHFVNKTIDYINSVFGQNVPYTHEIYGNKDDDIGDVVNAQIEKMFDDRTVNVTYIGETKFLPLDIIKGTKWEHAVTNDTYFGNKLPFSVILDVTNPENLGYHYEDLYDRIWERGTDDERVTGKSIAPYKNYHKVHVKKITDHYGISDKLLEITRSCEYSSPRSSKQMMDWEKHCEECLWCVERMITYGRCQ